jgi:hypothetical protein
MATMLSSSELLSISALMLANGRTGCTRLGRTACSSHPTVVLKWTAGDDPRWTRGEVKRGAFFGRLGQQLGTGGGRGSAGEGKGGGRERQGNTGEGWGNAAVHLSAGPRTRPLSGPTHSEPKFEAEMGACRHVQIVLSIWIVPLG